MAEWVLTEGLPQHLLASMLMVGVRIYREQVCLLIMDPARWAYPSGPQKHSLHICVSNFYMHIQHPFYIVLNILCNISNLLMLV